MLLALLLLPLAAAALTECDYGTSYDGNLRTLADGRTAWTCSRHRFAALRVDNGSATVTAATISSGEGRITVLQHMLTGYVCPVVLHNIDADCFKRAERAAFAGLLQASALDATSNHTYPGQPGLCFATTDTVRVNGLTPEASLVALAARNGQYGACSVSEYTRRTFVSSIWVGVTFLLPTLAGIGLTLATVAGLLPYVLLGGVCGGTAAGK
jgi:hypothetical protein